MVQPWRAIKRNARRAVHVTMQVPAVAIEGVNEYLVTLRVHDKQAPVGDLAGTNLSYAETRERQPSLIFWRYQFEPKRGMVISVESGEAYRVDHLAPADDTTVEAFVIPLDAAEAAGLPLPDAAGSVEYPLPPTWYPGTPTGGGDEFLPIPDRLAEDATYFYMGWEDVEGGWLIRRKVRASLAYTDADISNNGSYADLDAAWAVYATLVYV